MSLSHRKFGDLLEEGIKRVHITRKKPIGYILDEFGYQLRPDDSSKGRHALGHWYYKKRIPASMEDVSKLAELIITNSDVERDWLKAFLDSADYPETDKFCDKYFLPDSKNRPVSDIPLPKPDDSLEDPIQQFEVEAVPASRTHSRLSCLFGAIAVLSVAALFFWSRRAIPRAANLGDPIKTPTIQLVSPMAATASATKIFPTDSPIPPTPDFAAFDGKCPTVSSSPTFEYSSYQSFNDFLNSGGSFTILQSSFNALVQKKLELRDGRVISVDLTGDGIPEVIVNAILDKGSIWQILECDAGQYLPLADISDSEFRYLRFAVDLNGDKLPEIISYRKTQSEHIPLFEFLVQEWNGHQITNLIDNAHFNEVGKHLPADITDWQRTVANATVTTRDTNGDGLYELVVTGGLLTPVPTCETRFERQFTETWAWNGKSFQLTDRVYMLPIYRFQRSADGDLAFALNELDLALKAYQDVLFDANLFRRDQYLPQLEYCKGISSTPDAAIIEHEQDQLEAYARWRILLVNIIKGSQDAAQIVYQTLLDKFPDGVPGHSYTAIASAFWDSYQSTQNAESACEAANKVAGDQILYPNHTANTICFIP